MVQAGLTPIQTIVSASSTAARCLKAEFLLLRANPLDDIPEYAQVGIG
jgi:hypothetical protein